MAQTVIPPALQPTVQAGVPAPAKAAPPHAKHKKKKGRRPMPKSVPQAGPGSPGLSSYPKIR